MRMSVNIYDLDQTPAVRKVGEIVWDGHAVFAVPDIPRLRSILDSRIIGNWKDEIVYIRKDEPEKFLTCLHHQYRSPYLHASEAQIDDSTSLSSAQDVSAEVQAEALRALRAMFPLSAYGEGSRR